MKQKRHSILPALFLALPLVMIADSALAGGTGGSFIKPLTDFIVESLKGYVGTAIGVSGLLYGLVAGIVKGSLIGLGTGVGLAVGAYYGPEIISALASATLMAF